MNPPSIEQPCLQRAPGSESLANVTSPTEADTSAPDLRLVLPTPLQDKSAAVDAVPTAATSHRVVGVAKATDAWNRSRRC